MILVVARGGRGRGFALAVLGAAATEQGWIDVMDRIDIETRDGFPGDDHRGRACRVFELGVT